MRMGTTLLSSMVSTIRTVNIVIDIDACQSGIITHTRPTTGMSSNR
jgi:hypothetical protein